MKKENVSFYILHSPQESICVKDFNIKERMQTELIYSRENPHHSCLTKLGAFECILEQIFSALTRMENI